MSCLIIRNLILHALIELIYLHCYSFYSFSLLHYRQAAMSKCSLVELMYIKKNVFFKTWWNLMKTQRNHKCKKVMFLRKTAKLMFTHK